ncbi:hypothetical protein EV127DRAFT_492298 [Xylaria flabelliformis]|nr:hypothetical protein EV127DRAFT_492298 [Xylaria flabelliformis]
MRHQLTTLPKSISASSAAAAGTGGRSATRASQSLVHWLQVFLTARTAPRRALEPTLTPDLNKMSDTDSQAFAPAFPGAFVGTLRDHLCPRRLFEERECLYRSPDLFFGQFFRTLDDGATEVYRLPTGTPACRAFMQSLCMNQEEGIVAAAPSVDIIFKVSAADNLADAQAKFVRREGYFRALLVQSRGTIVAAPCADGPRGGCRSHNGSPFGTCRRVPNFQGGACAACVWRSHGARCTKALPTDPRLLVQTR